MARPNKYETHVAPRLVEIEDWVRNGATDEEVAKRLGIAYSTLREYKDEFSAFSAALKRGKDYVDAEVENALLKRALGYSYDEVTQELKEGKLVTTKTVTKQVVPDVTAQIFWLKNRRVTKWREKPFGDGADGGGEQSAGKPTFEFVFKDMSIKDEDKN